MFERIPLFFQDSVRQLLGGPRHTMRQLNNALDDALAGFNFDENKEDGLVIDENPRKAKSSPIKLKLNVAKSAASNNSDSAKKRKITQTSRATLEDMRMTKAHQVNFSS